MQDVSEAYLTCAADGNPRPTVIWFKGPPTNGVILTVGQNSASIVAGDDGIYFCVARNSHGSDSGVVSVKKRNQQKVFTFERAVFDLFPERVKSNVLSFL